MEKNNSTNIRFVKSGGREEPGSYKPEATIEDCKHYLSLFADGPWADYARKFIEQAIEEEKKKEEELYSGCTTLDDYNKYLKKYPDGVFKEQCKEQIERLQWESWQRSYMGCNKYVRKYPSGQHVQTAKERILVFQKKRKRFCIAFICAAIICLAIIAVLNWHPVKSFDTDYTIETVSKWGGDELITVFSNVSGKQIDAHVSQNWAHLKRNSDKQFVLSLDTNDSEMRQCTVEIVASSLFFNWQYASQIKEIAIKQASGLSSYLAIDKDVLSFDKFGFIEKGSSSLIIQGDGVSVKPINTKDWITISDIPVPPRADSFRIPVDIHVSKNTNDSRDAVVLFNSGGKSVSVKIKQESGLATYFMLEKESMRLSEERVSETKYYSCKVNTDGTTWFVYSSPSWIRVKADIDNNILRIETDKNSGNIKRGSIILRSNNNHSAKIDIVQDGNPTNLTPHTDLVSSGSGSGSQLVSINNDSFKTLSCSVSSYASDWLSAYENGNSIKIYYTTNNSTSRTGYVDVYCGDKHCRIKVKQDGWKTCNVCGGKGYKNCNAYGTWTTAYGVYSYGWVGDRHVIRRNYTTRQYDMQWGWIPVPAYEDNDCDKCHGTGRIKCNNCKNGRIVDKAY